MKKTINKKKGRNLLLQALLRQKKICWKWWRKSWWNNEWPPPWLPQKRTDGWRNRKNCSNDDVAGEESTSRSTANYYYPHIEVMEEGLFHRHRLFVVIPTLRQHYTTIKIVDQKPKKPSLISTPTPTYISIYIFPQLIKYKVFCTTE